MATVRVYICTEDGKPVALVRASSQAQAVRHVVRARFDAAPADQEMLIDALGKGMKVQDASDAAQKADEAHGAETRG